MKHQQRDLANVLRRSITLTVKKRQLTATVANVGK
jgi:hypothetical protein